MALATELDGLIQHIYDAAAEPSCWERVLREIAEPIGAIAPGIILRAPTPTDPGRRLTFDTDPVFNESWDEYYVRFEQDLRVMARVPGGAVTTCARILPEPIYLRSEMYNEWMRPQRRRHWIVALAWRDGPLAAGPSFQREEGRPDFGEDEVAFLQRLLPHFKQALRLQWRLEDEQAMCRAHRELTEALPVGVILVDARGRIVEVNQRAEAILGRSDGLQRRHGILVAARSHETRALRTLVLDAAATGAGDGVLPGGTLRLPRPSGRRPLQVLVTPVGRDTAFLLDQRRPAAAVLVSDPEDELELPEAHVRRLYGLTPAEARTAVELARGLSVREIAERGRVQENTVRWHLKQIYAKTDTRHQTELARLLLAGPLAMSGAHRPAGLVGSRGKRITAVR